MLPNTVRSDRSGRGVASRPSHRRNHDPHPPRRADRHGVAASSASQRTFDNNLVAASSGRDHDLVEWRRRPQVFLDAQRLPRQCGVSVNAMWLTNLWGDFRLVAFLSVPVMMVILWRREDYWGALLYPFAVLYCIGWLAFKLGLQ